MLLILCASVFLDVRAGWKNIVIVDQCILQLTPLVVIKRWSVVVHILSSASREGSSEVRCVGGVIFTAGAC